ncbi:MAG: tetratricopeptide repeat protein [Pseudomonadales bacterium]|nr:tetratricopeptide repeat protein [Pseudomonadales bacterium]
MQQQKEEKALTDKIEQDRKKTALYREGEQLYKEGKLDESREKFQALIELAPKFSQGHYRLGNIAFRSGQMPDAAKHFERVVELKPRHSKAHYNLAIVRLIQSEKHLKFYTATVDPTTDVSSISSFLGDIDEFSNALGNKSQKKDELDSIVGVIDKRN